MRIKKTIIIFFLVCALASLSAFIYLRFYSSEQAAANAASPTAAAASPSPEITPEPTPEPTPEYFTISMVGDCTLSSSQYNDHFEEILGGDMSWPFSGTLQYIDDDYLTIANLECSFSDDPLSGTVTFQFLAPVSYTEILTKGSVEFVTISNNHTTDFGDEGIDDTKSALDAAGIAWAGPDGSIVYQTGDGITIGLYSARWIATEDEIIAGVSALSSREDVDIVIALMHWGLEGSYRVTEGQTALGHAAIDAGADLVYGSHPHVLQKIEEYNGGYIFNSLGNWSFGGNTAPRDRDTAIIQVCVKRDTDGKVSVEGYSAIPCCLSSTPSINDYCPQPYDEGTDEWERAMSKLDGSWTGPDLVVDYSAYHQGEAATVPDAASDAEDSPAEQG